MVDDVVEKKENYALQTDVNDTLQLAISQARRGREKYN